MKGSIQKSLIGLHKNLKATQRALVHTHAHTFTPIYPLLHPSIRTDSLTCVITQIHTQTHAQSHACSCILKILARVDSSPWKPTHHTYTAPTPNLPTVTHRQTLIP